MLAAVTRKPSPRLSACELTHLPRQPIDFAKALAQHAAYQAALAANAASLILLPADPRHPDSVFVEDPAVVVDEVAVIARPGPESRRGETTALAEALAPFRELRFLQAPATLEGGDVLRMGKTLYVGSSARTNPAGIAQFAALLSPFGYRIVPVELRDCLHLKSACSHLGHDLALANRAWFDAGTLQQCEILDVPPGEPWGANVLRIGETVLVPASAPRTAELIESRGVRVRTIDISEFQKAEGGLTCMCIVFDATRATPTSSASPFEPNP